MENLKKMAGVKAAEYVTDGMVVVLERDRLPIILLKRLAVELKKKA